jgi:hypothetical protein
MEYESTIGTRLQYDSKQRSVVFVYHSNEFLNADLRNILARKLLGKGVYTTIDPNSGTMEYEEHLSVSSTESLLPGSRAILSPTDPS